MFRIILVLIFLISSVYADTASKLSFQKVLSLKQLVPTLSHAKKKSQFVLINFNTQNCKACDDLKTHTFSDTKVKTALENYHLIEITLNDHNKASFKKRFNVEKTPALVFLDKGGQFLPEFTTTGFVSSQQLLNIITRVHIGNEN